MKVNKKKFLISILAISTVAISSSAVIGLASTSQTKDNTNDVTSDSINTYTSVPMPGPTLDDPIVNSGGGNNGSGITTEYEIDWSTHKSPTGNVIFDGDFAYTSQQKTILLGMNPNTTIENVKLPTSVKEIRGYTNVTNEKSSKKFVGAFEDISEIKEVIIEGTDVKIAANTFKGCTSLEIVDMKNNAVRSIGQSAFEGCTSLKTINLSSSLTTLEDNVFKNTSSLTKITLPATLRSIGKSAFENSGITSVDMWSTRVTSIGNSAFKNTKNLSEVRFSNQLRNIGDYSFESSKINAITITSNSLSSIGVGAFKSCSSLIAFKITSKSSRLTSIPESIFENCISLVDIQFTHSSGTTSFRTIGKSAFKGTKITTFSIANVRTISESAFENCELLTALTGQNVLQTIGNNAFKNSSLKVISSTKGTPTSYTYTNLSNIVTIGVGAFYGTQITTFKSGTHLTTIGDDSFKKIDTLVEVDFASSKGLTRNNNAFDTKDQNKVKWPTSRVFRGNKIIF